MKSCQFCGYASKDGTKHVAKIAHNTPVCAWEAAQELLAPLGLHEAHTYILAEALRKRGEPLSPIMYKVETDDFQPVTQQDVNTMMDRLNALAHARATQGLTLQTIIDIGVQRSAKWHGGSIQNWTITDWSNAMMGEAGEACNAIKKLRRVQDNMANISKTGRELPTEEQAINQVAEELADTLAYLVLLASRLNIDLVRAYVEKFNAVSEEYGFPERLSKEGSYRDLRPTK